MINKSKKKIRLTIAVLLFLLASISLAFFSNRLLI